MVKIVSTDKENANPVTSADNVNSSGGSNPDAENGEGHVMTVIEHLDELRTRILRSLAVLVLCLVAALFLARYVVHWLEVPAGNISFQALSIEEPLLVYMKVAFYMALVAAAPYIIWEASAFVSPGLTSREKRVIAPVIVGGPVLFAAGVLFAYYCVLPPMLGFFFSFGQGITPINQRLDYYISLVCSVLLYMGLAFQIPIICFCLSFAGILNSRQLLAVWKYVVFGASIVAAVITPDPTAFSMLIVFAALVGLYFLSVLLLRLFGR